MILDLLSQSNYAQYNIELARIFGLKEAVYLNVLLDINSKAIRKDKIHDNCFIIDRNYVEQRTTINEKSQIEIEQKFLELGILTIAEDANISIDINVLLSMMNSANELTDVKCKKIKKKLTDAEKIEDLKSKIYLSCVELYEPLCEWIDSVYDKDKFMSYKSVINAQKLLESVSYNNGMKDVNVALEIIDIATINAWRDMQWAVNSYQNKQKYKVTHDSIISATINSEEQLSGEVF